MNNIRYKLRGLGYAEVGDDIWLANLYFNALIKINKSSGQIQLIEKFPNYDIYQGWLYSTVFHVDGYLVFIPNTSEEILVYHLKTQRFQSMVLDGKKIGTKKTYFVNAYVYNHYIYLFPTGAKCIVRYDVSTHSVKYLENRLSALIRTWPETRYCFYQQFEVIDTKIYVPFLDLNAVAVFDLEDESVEIRHLEIEGGCSTIKYVGGFFYLASWSVPQIYRWNIEKDEIKTYDGFLSSNVEKNLFLYSCQVEDKLLFFPEHCKAVMSLSLKTGEIKEEKRIYNEDTEPLKTFFVQKEKDTSYILTADMGEISSFEYKENKLSFSPYYHMDNPYNKKMIQNYLDENGYCEVLYEEENSLDEYLEQVSMSDKVKITKRDKNCGKDIFGEARKRA